MVPPSSHRIPRVRQYSGYSSLASAFAYMTLTFFGGLSQILRLTSTILVAVRTPAVFLPPVWPLPLSLATTRGISVDFSSSPYLDVSVQAVPYIYLCIQYMLVTFQITRLPHSEILGYNACLQLPEAYRS